MQFIHKTHANNLKIKTDCPYYQESKNCEYYNLVAPNDIVLNVNDNTKIDLSIAAEMLSDNINLPYYLTLSRNTINWPIHLNNDIGIIDAGYRGNLILRFFCFQDKNIPSTIDEDRFLIKKGTLIARITHPRGQKFNVIIVNKLSESERGNNGFGSTGK